jgi:hypothetical protein
MYDARLNLCRQVASDVKEFFGEQLFRTVIPRNVRLAEAPSFGKPILMYDVQSVGAKSYLGVGQELIKRAGGEPPAKPEEARADKADIADKAVDASVVEDDAPAMTATTALTDPPEAPESTP